MSGKQFECIQKLAGHSGEVWALAVSYKANFVVTGSHDKSIRIWEKTDEPVSFSSPIPSLLLLTNPFAACFSLF